MEEGGIAWAMKHYGSTENAWMREERKKMKLFVYSYREFDEADYFQQAAEEYGIEDRIYRRGTEHGECGFCGKVEILCQHYYDKDR